MKTPVFSNAHHFYLLRDVPCGVLRLFLLKCTQLLPTEGGCDPLYFPSLERLSPRPSISCPLPDQPNQQSLHTHHTCRPAVLSVRKALTFKYAAKQAHCWKATGGGKRKRQQGASMVMGEAPFNPAASPASRSGPGTH